jgi:small subunit ribosomal protein S18
MAEETRSGSGGDSQGSPYGESRGGGREGQGQRRGRFVRTPRVCPFCKSKVKGIDYKQADQLRRFVTERGKIKARRKVGTCARHQRMLAIAIKRARHIALLPFTTQHVRGE